MVNQSAQKQRMKVAFCDSPFAYYRNHIVSFVEETLVTPA